MRLAIAEDSTLLRVTLTDVLGRRGFDVVVTAEDGTELLRELNKQPVDIVIMDVRMPPTFTSEGIECALEVRHRWPDTGVLIVSQYVETTYATRLFSGYPSGVGYLLKDRVTEVGELVDTLERIAEGQTILDPEVVSQLIGASFARDSLSALTAREREVLELMAEGRTNTAISQGLHISTGTVEKYVSYIFSKFNLEPADTDHRRVLAVLKYLGVSQPPGLG